MNDLTKSQEALLAECLEELDAGAPLEECLARRPDDAGELRPYLELRSDMLAAAAPEPSDQAFDAGWRALLGRLNDPRQPERPRGLANVFGLRWRKPLMSAFGIRWKMFDAPLARAGVAVGVLVLVGGGALGVSAASGFEPARDVLSTLRIIDERPAMDEASPPGSLPDATRPDSDAAGAAPQETPPPTRASDDGQQRPSPDAGSTDSGAASQPPTTGSNTSIVDPLLTPVKDVTGTVDRLKPTPTPTRPPAILPAPGDVIATPAPAPINKALCDVLSNTLDALKCPTSRDSQDPARLLDDATEKLLPSLP
jgi:hypothetical protein